MRVHLNMPIFSSKYYGTTLSTSGCICRFRTSDMENLRNCIYRGLTVSSVQFSRSVVSDSLRPRGLKHARPPCPTTNSQSLLRLMSIESVMPSNHLILCRPLLFPPSIFPKIRVFVTIKLSTPNPPIAQESTAVFQRKQKQTFAL